MVSRRSRAAVRRARLAAALLCLLGGPLAAHGGAPEAKSRAREDAMPGGVPYDVRVAEIRRRIQEALVYPRLARRREIEGESEVEFAIAADGGASDIALVRSSGSALLDAAALRAVHDAAPLPPVLGRLRIPVRFQLASAQGPGEPAAGEALETGEAVGVSLTAPLTGR